MRTVIFEYIKILTCTVQNDIIVTPVLNIEHTSVNGMRLGIQEVTAMESGTDFKNKDDSFLDAATAVADIDTFYLAEGQCFKML